MLGMAALGAGEADEAWRLLEESVAVYQEILAKTFLSWALAFPGYAAHMLGRPRQAGRCFRRALRLAAEIKSLRALLHVLPGVAFLLADQGEVERAVELYALASRYPFVANSRWFEDVAGKHIASASNALPPQAVEAAKERGRARDVDATVQELLKELGGSPSA
jgi:tetratricopeptide (TPR) repeat protein